MKAEHADLVAAAQVGTRKAPPAKATEFELDGTERTLLLELGALGLMRRAGAMGVAASPVPASPPETMPVAQAASVIEEALDESMPVALEWARRAAARGFVAPPAVVARLVPLAVRHPEFRPLLGERGRWLARVLGVEIESLLGELPSADEWDTLSPKERVHLIEELPDESELFERALGDKRKEVREAAAERLVRIPGSLAAGELRERALAAVVVKRGLFRSQLEVTLPAAESLPKWLPRTAAIHGLGPGAMALHDLLAHVPPSAWGEAPDRLLDLAKGSEHATALAFAWQAAAVRFDDGSWIDAILPRDEAMNPHSSSAIMKQASEPVVERYVLQQLRAGGRSLFDATSLLSIRERPLSPGLSQAFVTAIARRGRDVTVKEYELGYSLPGLALYLDPSVLPLVEAGLGDGLVRVQEHWRKLLSLRLRLLKGLE